MQQELAIGSVTAEAAEKRIYSRLIGVTNVRGIDYLQLEGDDGPLIALCAEKESKMEIRTVMLEAAKYILQLEAFPTSSISVEIKQGHDPNVILVKFQLSQPALECWHSSHK